jgi:hypothetical protein
VGKIQVRFFRSCFDSSYVTSAGFDCGLAIALIIIFVCLSIPNGGINFNWWGNVAVLNTAVVLLYSRDLTVGFQWCSTSNARPKSNLRTSYLVAHVSTYITAVFRLGFVMPSAYTRSCSFLRCNIDVLGHSIGH